MTPKQREYIEALEKSLSTAKATIDEHESTIEQLKAENEGLKSLHANPDAMYDRLTKEVSILKSQANIWQDRYEKLRRQVYAMKKAEVRNEIDKTAGLSNRRQEQNSAAPESW